MKVIIAGSRDINSYNLIDQATKESGFDITEVVSGKANGVDTLGETWATNNGIPIKSFPALWDDFSQPCHIKTNKYGKKYNSLAGFNRNQQMAEYGDALICIHNGSNGSEDMMKKMKELGKPVFELKI